MNAVQREKIRSSSLSKDKVNADQLETDFNDDDEDEEELQGVTRATVRRNSPYFPVSIMFLSNSTKTFFLSLALPWRVQ